jgi:YD repeat-containing protein
VQNIYITLWHRDYSCLVYRRRCRFHSLRSSSYKDGKLKVTNALDAYQYDRAGRQTDVKNARGFLSTTVYDNANRPIAQVNPLGKPYDAAGQITAIIDPLNHVSTTEYDPAGQVTVTGRIVIAFLAEL